PPSRALQSADEPLRQRLEATCPVAMCDASRRVYLAPAGRRQAPRPTKPLTGREAESPRYRAARPLRFPPCAPLDLDVDGRCAPRQGTLFPRNDDERAMLRPSRRANDEGRRSRRTTAHETSIQIANLPDPLTSS